jgi:hypothetical protein
MHFQKEDLEGNHYQWTEVEKSIFIGQPSRRVFDKLNGNQVLFLINFFGELSDRFTLQEGKIIEQKIIWELPEYAKSEIAVFNWIRNSG